jgi:hypothetical protein
MITEFKNMPDSSRVLIYQATRELNNDEVSGIIQRSNEFIDTWKSHEKDLKATIDVRYNRFVIIIIDETFESVSGCSLDKSTRFIKGLEHEFQVAFFDRMNFAYKEINVVKSCNRSEFEHLISEGLITEDTIVFNNLVANKKELGTNWEVPFRDSWHSNLFALPQKV